MVPSRQMRNPNREKNENDIFRHSSTLSLHVLFSQFSPREVTPETCFFQIILLTCVCARNLHKDKGSNPHENITWSELGK